MAQVLPTLFSSNIRVGYPGNISSTDPSTSAPSVGDIALGIVYAQGIGVTEPFIDYFDSVTYGGQAMTHLDEVNLTAGGHYLWNAWYRVIDGTEVGSTFKPYWGGHVDLEYVAILIYRHADTLVSMTGDWAAPGAELVYGATMPFATGITGFGAATPSTYPTLAIMGMQTESVTVGGSITTTETGASEWTSVLTGSNLSGSARAHGRLWTQEVSSGDVLTTGDLTTTHTGGFSDTLDATFYGRGLFTFESAAAAVPDPADTEGGGSVYVKRHATARALPYYLDTGVLKGVPRGSRRR